MYRAIFLNPLAFQQRVCGSQDIKIQGHILSWAFESRFVHLIFKTHPSEIHFKNSVLSIYSINIWVPVLKSASSPLLLVGSDWVPKL